MPEGNETNYRILITSKDGVWKSLPKEMKLKDWKEKCRRVEVDKEECISKAISLLKYQEKKIEENKRILEAQEKKIHDLEFRCSSMATNSNMSFAQKNEAEHLIMKVIDQSMKTAYELGIEPENT